MPHLMTVYEEIFEDILGQRVSKAGPRLAQASIAIQFYVSARACAAGAIVEMGATGPDAGIGRCTQAELCGWPALVVS